MIKINKIVRILILSDFLIFSATGFISPIFAIFITQQIKGGDVRIVGFAAAIYFITKSLLQIPIGIFLDKTEGERDDFYFLIFGTLLAASVPFVYVFSSLPWHIYLLQIVYGLGWACAVPPWGALFTRYIDKGKEAMEWSIESTSIGLGTGMAGALGGIIASKFGFQWLFFGVGIILLIAALVLIPLYKYVKLKGDHYPERFKAKLL